MRLFVRKIHLWLTFLAGLFLLSAAVSGTTLLFEEEIDAWWRPDLRRVAPGGEEAPVDAVLQAAKEAYPGYVLGLAMTPRAPTDTYELWMMPEGATAVTDYLLVYVDPYRAEVLGARKAVRAPMLVLNYWHSQLVFGGTWGKALVALGGLALIAFVLTGLVLWWPQRGKLWRSLTVKRRQPWRRILYDLHRAAGFYLSPLLLVIALTGLGLVYHDASEALLLRVTGSAPPPEVPTVTPPATGAQPLAAGALLQRADALLPGAFTTRLRLPLTPEAPFIVRKRFPSEAHPNGKTYVVLDPYTGETLAMRNPTTGPIGWRLVDLLYPLHKGEIWSRPVHFALGVMVILFGASGLIMWWGRTRPHVRRRSPAAFEGRRRTPTLPPIEA